MLFDKNEILEALSGQIIDHDIADFNINEITIDSRKAVKNTAFIAIKGEINDGNQFAKNALENGCELAIIDNQEIFQQLKDGQSNLILVKNSFESLYDLAKYQRSQTKAKIIALTGSVGKTSVKDMLKSAFEKIGKTHATSSNFNNHYGLPLTMCNISKDDKFVILEIGMSNPGEIKPLSILAKPDIAIITNIAKAHIGNGFNSEDDIALEKSEILSGLNESGTIILNKDDKYCDFLQNIAIENNIPLESIISFGKDHNANYKLSEINIKSHDLSDVAVQTDSKIMHYEIATSNQVTILNSTIVTACLDIVTQNINPALESFKEFKASTGRTNIIKTDKFTIIDDSYNANLTSSKAGIQYLCDLKKQIKAPRSVAFIGDMLELGEHSDQDHQKLIKFCQEKNIDKIIPIGSEMQKAVKNLCIDLKTYLNCNEVANEISKILQSGDLIIVKGSRGMRLERIIEILKNL